MKSPNALAMKIPQCPKPEASEDFHSKVDSIKNQLFRCPRARGT